MTLSNSVLVVSPRPDVDDGSEDQVVIQDSLNELLELVPAVPKLHRMKMLLKGHEWEEGQEDEESFGAVRNLVWASHYRWLVLRGLFFLGEAEKIYPRPGSERTSGQRSRTYPSTQREAYTHHRW